jgi:4-hydroxy-4-methyl-2-oxoglutarate aldolase
MVAEVCSWRVIVAIPNMCSRCPISYLPGHLTHYVRVASGDFIFGDNDGVQLIPKDLVDEVLLRVEAIYNKENEEREQLAAGMPIDEVYRVYGVL